MIDSFKKLFGPEAENYTKFRDPYPEKLFDLLKSKIPKGSDKILDLACGTGKSTERLADTGLYVCACDHDPLMISEARKQAALKSLPIHYSVGEAESLPFSDQEFDVVTVGTAFHFFINEKALSEIRRVLKPGGLLFVYWTLTVKDIPEEDQIPSAIYRKYGWQKVPSELRDLSKTAEVFRSANFDNVVTEGIPIVIHKTVEERVGLQTTSGTYELLTPEDKKSFLEEVRQILTERLGDRKFFTLEEEIQVCLGYKKV